MQKPGEPEYAHATSALQLPPLYSTYSKITAVSIRQPKPPWGRPPARPSTQHPEAQRWPRTLYRCGFPLSHLHSGPPLYSLCLRQPTILKFKIITDVSRVSRVTPSPYPHPPSPRPPYPIPIPYNPRLQPIPIPTTQVLGKVDHQH